MPARQPFTRLCQQITRPTGTGRADLHLHTTHSDGSYTPAEVVDVARRSGLIAIAITDHDTMSGVAEARTCAPVDLEVIAGVEVTAEYEGRELHLLGYFVRPDDPALTAALARLCEHRRSRFRGMVERLRGRGVSVEDEALPVGGASLGRRTLAEVLERTGQVGSVREAFTRWLHDGGPADLPKVRLPLAEAIALVRAAGGVTSLAHPPGDLTLATLADMRDLGLQAVEADYPDRRAARIDELRRWAAALRLAVTGGSDCHGPSGPRRAVGACGVTDIELDALRRLAQS
jgi:predicted metal-dependent phosphoesterase TrpH